MSLTLAQLAAALNVELRGNGNVSVSGVATLAQAGPAEISFFANSRYRSQLARTRAAAVILNESDARGVNTAVLLSETPYATYAQAVRLLYPAAEKTGGIHPSASVDESARIDPTAWVGPQCVVEANAVIGARAHLGPASVIGAGVTIGEDAELVARVTVLAQARIGKRVRLHPGVVIGSDGFGMASIGGRWDRVPQIGSVVIGDDVDIGANTTVDRGSLSDTIIEEGVKVDNQVQVAHNVFIGAHTAIAGCVGISGSTRIGRHCTLAGGVGVVGHLTIADHVHVTAMSLVTHSISAAGTYSAGTPLMENKRWRRNAVRIKQLDKLVRRVNSVEKNKENK